MEIIRVVEASYGYDPIFADDGICTDPGIVAIAWADLTATHSDLLGNPSHWAMGNQEEHHIKPNQPIEPKYKAIHGLHDADLKYGASLDEVVSALLSSDDKIISFASFSNDALLKLIGSHGAPTTNIKKVSYRAWPQVSHFNKWALLAAANLSFYGRDMRKTKREAFASAALLGKTLNFGISLESAIEWSKHPAIMPKISIQALADDAEGRDWSEVSDDVLAQLERIATEFGYPDLAATAQHHIQQRAVDARLAAEDADLERQLAENGLFNTNEKQESLF